MANTFFEFKKFTVHQQFCAMKVSTDACIFGAHVAKTFAANELEHPNHKFNYLDIGAGTGLLSLMLAQKTQGLIDAIEIDSDAGKQAEMNVMQSPFIERLSIYCEDILLFKAGKQYDGIFCNPPFYENDLHSSDDKKNAAKHDTRLTLDQLIKAVKSHLITDGIFAILLPFHRVDNFIKQALLLNIFIQQIVLVKHSLKHPYLRGILYFKTKEVTSSTTELIIKNSEGNYSPEFIDLLNDYYLNL